MALSKAYCSFFSLSLPPPPPPPRNHSTSSSPQEWKPHPKHYANLPCQHEVFLGGSCNPTTWRKDSAIPTLHQKGVTYFNPQVDNWFPELIEIEEQAKMAASLLLFVVDDQTRAISSMVEVAYLAGDTFRGKGV